MAQQRPVTQTEGKFFAAGLKRLCRESGLPLTFVEAHISMRTDNGDTIVVTQSGVPPFTATAISVNGEVQTYSGYAADEQDAP